MEKVRKFDAKRLNQIVIHEAEMRSSVHCVQAGKSNSWGLCQLPSDVNRAQPWSGDTYHSCTGRLNEIPSQNVDDLYTRLGSDVEID